MKYLFRLLNWEPTFFTENSWKGIFLTYLTVFGCYMLIAYSPELTELTRGKEIYLKEWGNPRRHEWHMFFANIMLFVATIGLSLKSYSLYKQTKSIKQ